MSALEASHLAWFKKADHDFLSIANNLAVANRVRDAIRQRVPVGGAPE